MPTPTPNPTRIQIMDALYDLVVNASPQFRTKSRRVALWGDPEAAKPLRPYIAMGVREETFVGGQDGPPAVRTYNVHFYIYTDATNVADPSSLLNGLLDAVQEALRAPLFPAPGRQTLGGLVHNCWINGEIFKDPGDLDNDGMAIVPVKILVP